ncbi:MAG: hypothetical protein DSY89_01045 [Deltaproteobacteria bacterium]|nr:MAG: hypothetical protein DSY89_01045 [Deltaproteobacteria bacterium]
MSNRCWPTSKAVRLIWRFCLIKHFFSNWGPVIGFCVLIFIESSRPFPDLVPSFHFSDKLLHFTAWSLLGFLFFRAYRFHSPISNFKTLLFWISFISAATYGMSDEIHQYFVPSRTADIYDFVADAFGSFCGVFIGSLRYAARRLPVRISGRASGVRSDPPA